MLSRRQRLLFWLHEAHMPREQRLAVRSERRAQTARVREQLVANLGTAEGEGHYSRAADFRRS